MADQIVVATVSFFVVLGTVLFVVPSASTQ
jgi:hypothetical protein